LNEIDRRLSGTNMSSEAGVVPRDGSQKLALLEPTDFMGLAQTVFEEQTQRENSVIYVARFRPSSDSKLDFLPPLCSSLFVDKNFLFISFRCAVNWVNTLKKRQEAESNLGTFKAAVQSNSAITAGSQRGGTSSTFFLGNPTQAPTPSVPTPAPLTPPITSAPSPAVQVLPRPEQETRKPVFNIQKETDKREAQERENFEKLKREQEEMERVAREKIRQREEERKRGEEEKRKVEERKVQDQLQAAKEIDDLDFMEEEFRKQVSDSFIPFSLPLF